MAQLDFLYLSVTDGEARAFELNEIIKELDKRKHFSVTAFL